MTMLAHNHRELIVYAQKQHTITEANVNWIS